MKQVNFNALRHELTEDDIDQIINIIGSRCREKTLRRLRSMLTYGMQAVSSYGIFNRLVKENGRWEYVAGQSYVDEIRMVRECILGKV